MCDAVGAILMWPPCLFVDVSLQELEHTPERGPYVACRGYVRALPMPVSIS